MISSSIIKALQSARAKAAKQAQLAQNKVTKLDEHIAGLMALQDGGEATESVIAPPATGKRTMSPAAKAKLSKFQKKLWAARKKAAGKKGSTTKAKPAKAKSTLSKSETRRLGKLRRSYSGLQRVKNWAKAKQVKVQIEAIEAREKKIKAEAQYAKKAAKAAKK